METLIGIDVIPPGGGEAQRLLAIEVDNTQKGDAA